MAGRLGATLDLIRFDRPVGWLLLFLPAGWSILLARPGEVEWKWMVIFLVGSFLTRSAGCVINDLFDREIDRKVARTKSRPLADGRLSPRFAAVIFFVLTLASASLLLFFSKIAILVAVVGYGSAVIYPLMKRFFPLPQLFMGIPFGATAPLMAWVQITGEFSRAGVFLSLAGLFWATAYDLIYAVADLPDDRLAGIKSGAVTFGAHLWAVFLFFSILTAGLLWAAGRALPQSGWLFLSLFLFLVVVGWQSSRLKEGMGPEEPLRLFRSHVLLGALVMAGLWTSSPILV